MEGAPLEDSRAAILAWRSLVFTPRYRQDTTATTDRRAARTAHGGMVRAQCCSAGVGSSDLGSRPPPFPACFFSSIVAGSAVSASLPTLYTSNNPKRKEKGRFLQSSVPVAAQLVGGVKPTSGYGPLPCSASRPAGVHHPRFLLSSQLEVKSTLRPGTGWRWGKKQDETHPDSSSDSQRTDTSFEGPNSGRSGSEGQRPRRHAGPRLALATEDRTCCASVSLPYFYLVGVFRHADLFPTCIQFKAKRL